MHAHGVDDATIADSLRAVARGSHAATSKPVPRKSPGKRLAERLDRRAESPRAPALLPQHAPAPSHAPPVTREDKARAETRARRSAQERFPDDPGRILSYWAPWVHPWFRRAVESQAQSTRELLALPEWVRARVLTIAEVYGGKGTHAGRHVIAFCALVYWHARGGRHVISGLSAGAWTSLTVGVRKGKKHYHHSTIWHRYHDIDGPMAAQQGPYGGMVGDEDNCGLLVVLEREGFIRAIQPDGRCSLPSWLVGDSGYAFAQVLITVPLAAPSEPLDDKPPDSLSVLGVRIEAAPS